jgi:hypothetical protein
MTEQSFVSVHCFVSVRHHLAGRELLLSPPPPPHMVLLRCSYCRSSREHEFLDLGDFFFFRVIELLRAVKEN